MHTQREEDPALRPTKAMNEEDREEFNRFMYAGAEGANLEQAERRKNLASKSAILVYLGTKFVGVQAGIGSNFATFPMQTPVERTNGTGAEDCASCLSSENLSLLTLQSAEHPL